MDLVVTALGAAGGAFGGALMALQLFLPHGWRPLAQAMEEPEMHPEGGHKHRFDTQRGDGRGWVCGICGWSREFGSE